MVRVLHKQDWFHSDGFPISVARRDPQEPFGLHAHDFSELVIVTGGSGLHITGEESWPVSAGDVFVISGSRPHDYRNMDRLALINILFESAHLETNLFDLPSVPGYHALFTLEPAWRRRHQFQSRLRLGGRELATVVESSDRLEAELKRREPGFRFAATAQFMQLVGFLSRCYGQSKDSDSRSLLRIARTISHLQTHYEESVNLDRLAEMARMPKRSFLRTFKKATGTTPVAYLIELRIERATTLLQESDRTITDIAFDVGFNDSNYFSRKFRQQTGHSPRTYRQSFRRLG